MTPFEYLSVLISIVLGLGLAELLSSARSLVRDRDRVRFHWLPLAWSVLVFVVLVQWWWAAFGFRDRMEWNFFAFLLILLVPVLLYLVAALALPNGDDGGREDLRGYYFEHHRPFFGTLAAATLLEAGRALLANDLRAAGLNLAGTALVGSLAVVRNPRYHAAATVASALLLAGFIVAETLRIA